MELASLYTSMCFDLAARFKNNDERKLIPAKDERGKFAAHN
tara:strand:+ start:1942 stop:2064 length:123 start_codon:yes stop_codon:yes gene_type:complete